MLDTLINASGGLGLFLVGMIVMTDGLRRLAGDSMRLALMRFTRSPLSGAVTGAVATAVLQSSSAMTVAAVGFVGAGLLGFAEALGIIFGANIGTTITGWLVALLGFKLKLGTVVLPLILVGALMRLFGQGRVASSGTALAGFGLIFVGIALMQTGMAGLQDVITPAQLPQDTWTGRLSLVALGMLITIITQSSSAGVAAAITAVHVGTINLNQAAAMVIGMDIGTTVTALLATVGGSVDARRTGLSHVIYNLLTGTVALLMISPFVAAVNAMLPGQIESDPELVLVAFHSSFNLLGVILVLPFTQAFARLIESLVPQSGGSFAQRLPRELLDQPALALNLVQQSALEMYRALLAHLAGLMHADDGKPVDLAAMQRSLDDTHQYLDDVRHSTEMATEWDRAVALFHVLDHLQRLHERCDEEEYRARTVSKSAGLEDLRESLTQLVSSVSASLAEQRYAEASRQAKRSQQSIDTNVEAMRAGIITRIPSTELKLSEGTDMLEALRWSRRCSKHIADIACYLEQAILAGAASGRRSIN